MRSLRLKRPTLATLVISKDWSGMYFQWKLLLFRRPKGLVRGGVCIATATLLNEAQYGTQKEAISAACEMAKLFKVKIDRRMVYKEES